MNENTNTAMDKLARIEEIRATLGADHRNALAAIVRYLWDDEDVPAALENVKYLYSYALIPDSAARAIRAILEGK